MLLAPIFRLRKKTEHIYAPFKGKFCIKNPVICLTEAGNQNPPNKFFFSFGCCCFS